MDIKKCSDNTLEIKDQSSSSYEIINATIKYMTKVAEEKMSMNNPEEYEHSEEAQRLFDNANLIIKKFDKEYDEKFNNFFQDNLEVYDEFSINLENINDDISLDKLNEYENKIDTYYDNNNEEYLLNELNEYENAIENYDNNEKQSIENNNLNYFNQSKLDNNQDLDDIRKKIMEQANKELVRDISIIDYKNYDKQNFIYNSAHFNSIFSIHDILIRNGYTPVLTSRINSLNLCNNLYFTKYISIPALENHLIEFTIKQNNNVQYIEIDGIDLLENGDVPQNAFEFYCYFECQGKIKEAIDKWQTDINNNIEFIREIDTFKIQELAYKYNLIVCNQSVQTLPKQTTLNKELIRVDHFLNDEPYYYSVDLLRQVSPNHIMRRLAEHIAKTCDLPVSTVFLIGLAVFSGMSCRKWVVEYPDGGTLPTCLYVVAEQPSGTSKTRALTSFQRAFTNIINEIIGLYNENFFTLDDLIENEKKKEKKKEIIESMIDYANSLMPTTNTTPAGLEQSLIDSNGFFSAVSSEQGLFNTLLGLNLGGGKYNNNDILLNGRDGGFINVRRMGRDCYAGHVVGNIICFAQEGSIEKVISASNGTGVSERFLMIAEPHQLGQRNHTKLVPHQPELFREYENKCLFIKDILDDQARYDDLIKLKITENDWYSINLFKNKVEPYLMDGQNLSHGVIRGAVNKVSMQVMGIAANLHLLEDEGKNTTIASKHIQTAIDITNQLIESLYNVCVKKDMIGTHAEFKAILDFFVGKPESFKPTAQEIKKSRTKVKPFTSYNRKSLRVQQALDQLVEANLLLYKDNRYILNCIM